MCRLPHAELHGKLSSTGSNLSEGMEDLLTSDIFGRLRYLEPKAGLVPILQGARSFATGTQGLVLPGDITAVTYTFWPQYPRAEPDVVVQLQTTGGPFTLLVECKYRSGKSGEDDPADAPVTGRKVKDQLAREYTGLIERHGRTATALLYLTGHRTMPKDKLESSARSLGANESVFRRSAYWMGWHTVRQALAQAVDHLDTRDRLILEDMMALLAHKGFRSFEGWPVPAGPIHAPAKGSSTFHQSVDRWQLPALRLPTNPEHWIFRRQPS